MTQPTLPGLEAPPQELTSEDPREGCTRVCLDMIQTELSVTVYQLYHACRQRWPDYVEELTLRQFHARHALPAKRAAHQMEEAS